MEIIKLVCIKSNSKYIKVGEIYTGYTSESLPCNVSNSMSYITGIHDRFETTLEYEGKTIYASYFLEDFVTIAESREQRINKILE